MVFESAKGLLMEVDLEEVQSMVKKLEELVHAVEWSVRDSKILVPHFGIKRAAQL